MKYPSIVGSSIVVLALSAFAGCSSTTKPETASAGSAKPASESKENGAGAGKSSQSSSSLESLQRGESSATSASSPLKEVYFGFDSYNLRADAREMLNTNAAWLKNNASTRIQVEGHCDERGTNEYNLALGAKRAQIAKDYLQNLGISGERISTISYGGEISVCNEHNEDCWQKNRRDRFVIEAARPTN